MLALVMILTATYLPAAETVQQKNVAESAKEEIGVNLDSFVGTWVLKDFLDTLQSTKSPIKACKTARAISNESEFVISQSSGIYYLEVGYNFHEGTGLLYLRGPDATADKDTYRLHGSSHTPAIGVDQLLKISGRIGKNTTELIWISSEAKRNKFVRLGSPMSLGDSGKYLAELVLSGNYKDEKGRSFVFSGDHIKWPGKTDVMNYQMDTDCVFPSDSFMMLDKTNKVIRDKNDYPLRYGFDWKDNKLYIYEVEYKNGEEIAFLGKPIHILSPVQTAKSKM